MGVVANKIKIKKLKKKRGTKKWLTVVIRF